MMKEVSDRILPLSLHLPCPMEESQLRSPSWHIRHAAMTRMITLMMIQALELPLQQLSLRVIDPHDIAGLHPVSHILWLLPVAEFEIIQDIKVLFCLLPPLRTAFQSANDECPEEDHGHDCQHRERQPPHTRLRLLKDLLDPVHCDVDILHYDVRLGGRFAGIILH